jgi:hypothetical protein
VPERKEVMGVFAGSVGKAADRDIFFSAGFID